MSTGTNFFYVNWHQFLLESSGAKAILRSMDGMDDAVLYFIRKMRVPWYGQKFYEKNENWEDRLTTTAATTNYEGFTSIRSP
jgi:hypothetical protein